MPRSYLNPFMISAGGLWGLFTVHGEYRLGLRSGTYLIKVHGAGGAGGENGGMGWPNATAGAGGAGGTGEIITRIISVPSHLSTNIHVGAGGLTHTNGGNGGAGGAGGGGSSVGGPGGAGGGGGEPSYIAINNTYYVAEGAGGGGGGGGGGTTAYNNASRGGAGGGGGGYYRFSAGAIIAVDGKTGGNQTTDYGQAGTDGNTTDFPTIASGRGATGTSDSYRIAGGAGASGGGASGASGGGWASYSSGGSFGGGGGGAAGGSLDAGGGGAGAGGVDTLAQPGSNAHTIPTASVDYLGNVVTSGWGVGGTTDTDGADGWVYITRTGPAITIDNQGLLSDETITDEDNGSLTDAEIITENNGVL